MFSRPTITDAPGKSNSKSAKSTKQWMTTPSKPSNSQEPVSRCSVDNCEELVSKAHLCQRHYLDNEKQKNSTPLHSTIEKSNIVSNHSMDLKGQTQDNNFNNLSVNLVSDGSTSSRTNLVANEQQLDAKTSSTITSRCEYRISTLDDDQCQNPSLHKCSHCSSLYCLEHSLQHQEDLKEDINCLLDEAQELIAEIPSVKIESGRKNCIEQFKYWMEMILDKIKQKYKEFQMELDQFHNYIESNKDQWKIALAHRIEMGVTLTLLKELQKHEINGLEVNKARDELIRTQKLCDLLNSQTLISVTFADDNELDLNKPRLVFSNIHLDSLNGTEEFSTEKNPEMMDYTDQEQEKTNKDQSDTKTNDNMLMVDGCTEHTSTATHHMEANPVEIVKTIDQTENVTIEEDEPMTMDTYEVASEVIIQSTNYTILEIDPPTTEIPQNSNGSLLNTMPTNQNDDEGTTTVCSTLPVVSSENCNPDQNDDVQSGVNSEPVVEQYIDTVIRHLLANTEPLTILDLSKNQLGNAEIQRLSDALESNNTVTTLDLHQNKITDDGIASLSKMLQTNTTLTTVHLHENKITFRGAQSLSNMLQSNQTLTVLNLSDNLLRDKGVEYLIRGLQANNILTTLELSWNQIGDKGARHLSTALGSHKALTTLHLSGNMIGNEGAYFLGNILQFNKTLKTLNLSGNPLGDEGIVHLSTALPANKALTTLDVSWNQIGNKGIHDLSSALEFNQTLRTLNLNRNKMTHEGMSYLCQALQSNRKLRELKLSWNQIGNEGAKHLSVAIQLNKTLTTLEVSWNQIGNEGGQRLGAALQLNKTLTVLNLSGNEIGDEGIQYICVALQWNNTLTTLNLSGNAFGDEGAQYLATTLQQNKTLTTLDLSWSEIGNKGIQSLSTALKVNSTLMILNLSGNAIGDEGIYHISVVLQSSKTLTTVNLSGNQIGNEGARHLASALTFNRTLTTLDLSRNQIRNQGVEYLNDGLVGNETLTMLDLTSNGISEETLRHFGFASRTNEVAKTPLQYFF